MPWEGQELDPENPVDWAHGRDCGYILQREMETVVNDFKTTTLSEAMKTINTEIGILIEVGILQKDFKKEEVVREKVIGTEVEVQEKDIMTEVEVM